MKGKKVWRMLGILVLGFSLLACGRKEEATDASIEESVIEEADLEDVADAEQQEEEQEEPVLELQTDRSVSKELPDDKLPEENSPISEFMNLGEDYLVLAVGNVGSLPDGGDAPIYQNIGDTESVSVLQLNCAVLVDLDKIDADTKGIPEWIPVKIAPHKAESGYVKAEDVCISAVRIKNPTDNAQRNLIIEDAITHMGSPFEEGGDSFETGIDCSHYVKYLYSLLDIELPVGSSNIRDIATQATMEDGEAIPGDIIFYYLANNGNGHTGLYLGNGFIISAAGHDGTKYPKGGVRISRLKYHHREEHEFLNFIDVQ